MKTRRPASTNREALTRLAEFLVSPAIAEATVRRVDRVKQHIVDTCGARLAGSRLDEGLTIGRLAASMPGGLAGAVLAGCAQARCTEIDDIHLTSCTTPGSVIVPTVLALAASGDLRSVHDVCSAALAGYEALTRLGVAMGGPALLRKRVWPTHAAAAFGSTAVACRAYGATVDRTAGALATTLALGSGRAVSAGPPSSSRWLTLGLAASNGVIAAQGAREGLVGTAFVSGALDGVSSALAKDLGRRFLFDDVGMKPYPTARQALAAIEAARQIVDAEEVQPADIDAIDVHLPEAQRVIVDHPAPPTTRFASIVSVQYQIAVALVAPATLFDVRRTPPLVDEQVRALMSKIRVRRARDLERHYPSAWPGRVEIRCGRRRCTRVVQRPYGDAGNRFDWEAITRKFHALVGPVIDGAAAARVVAEVRSAGVTAPMPPLWNLR